MIKSNASERRDFFTKSFKFCAVSASRINSEVAGDISTFNFAKPHMKSDAAMISSKQSISLILDVTFTSTSQSDDAQEKNSRIASRTNISVIGTKQSLLYST